MYLLFIYFSIVLLFNICIEKIVFRKGDKVNKCLIKYYYFVYFVINLVNIIINIVVYHVLTSKTVCVYETRLLVDTSTKNNNTNNRDVPNFDVNRASHDRYPFKYGEGRQPMTEVHIVGQSPYRICGRSTGQIWNQDI